MAWIVLDVVGLIVGVLALVYCWAQDIGAKAAGKVMGLAELYGDRAQEWLDAQQTINEAMEAARIALAKRSALQAEIDRAYLAQMTAAFERGQRENVGVFTCLGCDEEFPRNMPGSVTDGVLELCAECQEQPLPFPAYAVERFEPALN